MDAFSKRKITPEVAARVGLRSLKLYRVLATQPPWYVGNVLRGLIERLNAQDLVLDKGDRDCQRV